MKKVVGVVVICLLIGAYSWIRVNGSNEKNDMQMRMMNHSQHENHASLVKDDKSFIQEMIPHHEEAITSSQELLKVAKTPEVRNLAENIITTQKKEVADMKSWYKEWFKEEYKPTGNYKPMMSSLKGKSSQEAEHSYLMDMIMHHQAAVVMAKKILPIAQHEEIKTLGNSIIVTQNKEIRTMQSLMRGNHEHMRGY